MHCSRFRLRQPEVGVERKPLGAIWLWPVIFAVDGLSIWGSLEPFWSLQLPQVTTDLVAVQFEGKQPWRERSEVFSVLRYQCWFQSQYIYIYPCMYNIYMCIHIYIYILCKENWITRIVNQPRQIVTHHTAHKSHGITPPPLCPFSFLRSTSPRRSGPRYRKGPPSNSESEFIPRLGMAR